MLVLLIRGAIIYIVVIASVRLMGKRQIGELQPAELVITILLSEIASIPLQDGKTPLVQSIAAIFLLIALEIITSCLSLKFRPFRTALQGNSIMLINKGEIVQSNMKKIRYSVDDIMEALRMKDVFDLDEVSYAYVETNGELSVLLKSDEGAEDLPCLVISDGRIVRREFAICNLTEKKLLEILRKKKLSVSDVLLMTYSKGGKTKIVVKRMGLK